MNSHRANDSFVDSLSGDAMKKLHQERESNRSQTRNKIPTFTRSHNEDSKSVL
jgi:hypothetical protein